MILHLVTDRRRLAGPGASPDAMRACLLRQIERAIEAGVDAVQIRERDLEAAALASLVRDAVDRARGSATRILVNDRADIAIACGAGGVHLRADSLAASAVRRLIAPGADFLIGRSVHSVPEAMAAAPGADYLIAGTVWATGSKPPDHPLLGVNGVRAIAAAVSIPVLAIGGVTAARATDLRAAGAAGAAGIGLYFGDSPDGCRAQSLGATVAALKQHA